MQPPRQHEVRLVITRILRPPHTPRPGGRRFPPPRFRSATPPPASPPTPRRRCSAPRPAASCEARRLSDAFSFSCFFGVLDHIRRASHHASGPPRFPSRRARDCASVRSFVSSTSEARAATSGRYGVKCCPRHSRRFRTPIVVCAAWSFLRDHLTPRPAVAKSTYRFCVRKIRCSPALQNTGKGGGASTPAARVPGEVGWASMVQAVIRERRQFVASIRREHQPQPSPALGRSGAGCRKIAHPTPHGPTLDQKRQGG